MIAVVDYGLGNLHSVSKALEANNIKVKVTSNPSEIFNAKAIVLPGVGAFLKGMENLEKLNLLEVIVENIKKGKPFLGICLGLQLLFTRSFEHKLSEGMGIFKGEVVKFLKAPKIPHIGWNRLNLKKNSKIFEGIPPNVYFYFVHSYYVKPEEDIVLATTFYGEEFPSAVAKDNIFGVQFHPEKSGKWGLKFLSNFVKLVNAG